LAQLPDNEDSESNAKRLHKSIRFEHRITNTKEINETEVKPKTASTKELKRKGLPLLAMFLVVAGMVGFTLYKGAPKTIVYPYAVKDGVTEHVRAKTKSDDSVTVTSTESEFEIEEKFSEFTSKINGKPSLGEPSDLLMLYIMMSVQVLLVGGMLITIVYEYTRNRRLLRIIKEL
jgi:hypothetical protein